jgi:O-antigen ligase
MFSLRFPKLLLFIYLSSSSGALFYLGGTTSSAGYSQLRTIQIAVGLLLILSIVFVGKFWSSTVRKNSFGWLFILFASISLTWSDDLRTGVGIVALLSLHFFIALLVSHKISRARLFDLTAKAMFGFVLLSQVAIYFELERTKVTIFRLESGRVEIPVGVFGWNSELGFAASFSFCYFLHQWIKTKSKLELVLSATSFWFLIASDSAGWLLSGVICAVVLISRYWLKNQAIYFSLIIFSIVLLIPFSNVIANFIARILGKSETFTGRTGIWRIFLENQESQFIGAGISGNANLALGFEHAHNGFLQVYFCLGILGILILLLLLGQALLFNFRLPSDDFGFPLLVSLLIANSFNNYLLSGHLLVFLVFYLISSSKEEAVGNQRKSD